MHVMLARLEGTTRAIVIVDDQPPRLLNYHADWPAFASQHRGATIFGCDVRTEYAPEEDNPKGHFDDPNTVKWVNDQLRAGNDWAWFWAKVTAHRGSEQAIQTLGACSYRSEADWLDDGSGYFGSMVQEAASELQARFMASFGTFEKI